MNALIIEDNADHREILRENLRLCGVSTFCERSTLKAALKTLSELSFDVICLDLKLEDATPQETIATLPIIASFAGDAALIVISGYQSLLTSCVEKHCNAMIAKPYNLADFRAGFERAMRRAKRPVFSVSLLLHNMTKGKLLVA